jgi:hypothetical protein
MKELYQALFSAKQEMTSIKKDMKNPFFKSNYADINSILEQVEPILNKHKLLILQPIVDGNVVTQIVHVDSGELISSSAKLSNLTDPQKIGSEITYFRRYTLQSLLSLQAEDDDGNAASGKTIQQPKYLKPKGRSDAFNTVFDYLTTSRTPKADMLKAFASEKVVLTDEDKKILSETFNK